VLTSSSISLTVLRLTGPSSSWNRQTSRTRRPCARPCGRSSTGGSRSTVPVRLSGIPGATLRGAGVLSRSRVSRPTRLMERLAEGAQVSYRFVNTEIKYSSGAPAERWVTRHTYQVPPGAKFARFSHLHRHRDRKINVVGSLMSGNLGDARTKVYKGLRRDACKPGLYRDPGDPPGPEPRSLQRPQLR